MIGLDCFRSRFGLIPACALVALACVLGCGKATLQAPEPDAAPMPIEQDPDAVAIAASFEMQATLDFEREWNEYAIPERHVFVLRVEDEETRASAIAGTPGRVSVVEFERTDDGRRALRAPITLDGRPDAEDRASVFPCLVGDIVYETMVLTLRDQNADTWADSVEGTATGYVQLVIGGLTQRADFSATLAGSLDSTPPQLLSELVELDRTIASGLAVVLDEPVEPDTTASLRATKDGSAFTVALVAEPSSGSVSQFVVPDDVLLPFDQRFEVQFSPDLSDLGGNKASQSVFPVFDTMVDPGLVAAMGFESAGTYHVGGGAAAVASVGSVEAISGQRSLRVEPGGSVTVHLDVTGASHVMLRVRGLFEDSDSGALAGKVMVASAAAEVPSARPFPNAGATVPTDDPDWSFASAQIDTLHIPLPSGAADDVVVQISVPALTECAGGLGTDSTAVLIDDIEPSTGPSAR